jgi:hypothetical protein
MKVKFSSFLMCRSKNTFYEQILTKLNNYLCLQFSVTKPKQEVSGVIVVSFLLFINHYVICYV